MMGDLSAYEMYWASDRLEHALLSLEPEQVEKPEAVPLKQFLVIHPGTGRIIAFENDASGCEVKRRMLAAGVPILSLDTFVQLLTRLPPPTVIETKSKR